MRHEIRGYAHSVVTLLRRMMAADPGSVLDSKWVVTWPLFQGFGGEELFEEVGDGDAVIVPGQRIVEQLACLDEDEGELSIYRIRGFIDLEIGWTDGCPLVLNAAHEKDADFFFSYFRNSRVTRLEDKKLNETRVVHSRVHHLIDAVREVAKIESWNPDERVNGALWKVEASEVELYRPSVLIEDGGVATQNNLLRFLALVKQPLEFKAVRYDPKSGASDFVIEGDRKGIRIEGLHEGKICRYVLGNLAAMNINANRSCFW